MRAVFNGFANSFAAKLAELGYDAPKLTAQAVAEALGPPHGNLRVVDAGCGTGLCAPLTFPKPVAMAAMKGKTQADDDKMGTAVQRVCDDDPTLREQMRKLREAREAQQERERD